ncbi:MAG: hypothetical protein ACHREM_02450 [Polyangiales bacterium]
MHDPFGKLLAFVVGGAIVAGSAYFGLDEWRDYQTFGDTPEQVGLLDAVEISDQRRQWVAIDSRGWRCDRVLRNVPGGAAFVPATALDGSVVVARFDHEIDCARETWSSVTGVIEPMSPSRAADLRAAGVTIPEGARRRTFDVCAHCGRGNSLLGVVLCTAFAILGVFLYPIQDAFMGLNDRWHHSIQRSIAATGHEEAAALLRLRVHGSVIATLGLLGVVVGRGYRLWRVIPMPILGALLVLFGGWIALFPSAYRRVARRAPR